VPGSDPQIPHKPVSPIGGLVKRAGLELAAWLFPIQGRAPGETRRQLLVAVCAMASRSAGET
jgi:hypothetical protein